MRGGGGGAGGGGGGGRGIISNYTRNWYELGQLWALYLK